MSEHRITAARAREIALESLYQAERERPAPYDSPIIVESALVIALRAEIARLEAECRRLRSEKPGDLPG